MVTTGVSIRGDRWLGRRNAHTQETAEVMRVFVLPMLVLVVVTRAEVRVFVEESNGLALIKYECTAGEAVRAFALDVRVDRGRIVGISHFFRGESRAGSRGYGIFPASFRDHLTVTSRTNVNWESSDYCPLAVRADYPADTLAGLGASGVTLELGALWDPSVPEAIPGPAGTLCALHLSEAAQVWPTANASRGGVIPALADVVLTPVFDGAFVDPTIQIRDITLVGGVLTINFQGGELESASSIEGPWVGTGNRTGQFMDSVGSHPARFYRVRRL